MARVFNLVVFDQTISGNTATVAPRFYTSQEHADLLGSVDRLQFQMIIRGASDFTNPVVVRATYQMTNSPDYDLWTDTTVKPDLTVNSASDVPGILFQQVTSFQDRAAYGRFAIECRTDNVAVQFQLVISGYAE